MNQKVVKQKGITLIALVITVILLLILAGVTITIAINTGVMDKSEKTVETWKVEDYKERIELAKTEEFLNKSTDRLPEKLKALVVRNLEGEKNENWVKRVRTDETGNAELAEDEIEVLTTDGYIIIAKIDEKNGEITWISVKKDNGEPYPTLTLNQKALEGTENEKVKVEVKVEVEETKKTKNIAKIEVIQNGKVIETRNYETLEVTDIFEIELKGEYIFKATTNQDQSTSKKLITNIEGTENKIEITAEPTTPRNTLKTEIQNGVATGPIKVKIEYGETKLKKLYSTDGEKWEEVTGTSKELEIKENCVIVAKYSDGINAFNAETYNIQNVDNVAPNTFNITETHTTNSITVTASTTDTASSGAASGIEGVQRYEYKIDGGSWGTSETFTGLTTGTHTVQAKAIDKAGNETISTNTLSIPLDTVPVEDVKIGATPTTARNTAKTTTQNGIATGPISVEISYGNSNYTREYKIGSGDWQSVTGTSASFTVTTNTTIVARYYDGTNGFETETYNIQNVDNVAPTFSSYNATLNGTTITASGSATDEASEGAAESTSGISGYAYSIDGTSYQTSTTFTISSAGTYTVYIKAIDKAGNETIVNKSVTGYTLSRTAETGGTVSGDSGIKASGQSCTITATASTGYSFSGWYNGSTKVSSSASYTFDMLASNYSLTAKFTINSYTLSRSASTGGTVSGDSGTKTYGQSCTVTAVANTGYSFSGWYNGSTRVSTSTSYTFNMPASNYSLTAKFTAIGYTLSRTAETGGTVSGDSGTKTYGQSCTVTAVANTGYSFRGWYNGSTRVSTSASYTFNMPASNYSLTAKFTAITYTVTLYKYGSVYDTLTSTGGSSVTLPSCSVNSDDDSFYGWTTTSGSTTRNYASGASVIPTSDMSLYAIFKYYGVTYETISVTSHYGQTGASSYGYVTNYASLTSTVAGTVTYTVEGSFTVGTGVVSSVSGGSRQWQLASRDSLF